MRRQTRSRVSSLFSLFFPFSFFAAREEENCSSQTPLVLLTVSECVLPDSLFFEPPAVARDVFFLFPISGSAPAS
jgi:hypothetical protein